jgi:hypothetical protein
MWRGEQVRVFDVVLSHFSKVRHGDPVYRGGTLKLSHTLPHVSFRQTRLVMSLYHLSFPFPNMNPRELVDHIRSGPAVLVLEEPLRFRRRTRSNPCDFNEFLEALRSSETIRTVRCRSQHILGIREDEWVLLVKALGRIRDIQNLRFDLAPGSRDFHPFQAVADAINSAHSLQTLTASPDDESFLRDSSGLTALANAIRKQTGLQFTLIDRRPPLEAVQSAALDPVLQALSACLRL